MSSEAAPSVPLAGQSLPELSLHERRVLGVLVEKAMTTRDAGPLSMNSLVAGCNQKSNRDPVMTFDDSQAEEALLAAQKKGLVTKIMGSGRVERWKHNLYDAWHVSRTELAILTELLLRGPQTEGELRGRASRMEPIADLDALRNNLKSLVERRLVVYLTPEGRRGTMVSHGFHGAAEVEHLRARLGVSAEQRSDADAEPVASSATPRGSESTRFDEACAEIADLRAGLTDLQKSVANIEEQVAAIKQGLGL